MEFLAHVLTWLLHLILRLIHGFFLGPLADGTLIPIIFPDIFWGFLWEYGNGGPIRTGVPVNSTHATQITGDDSISLLYMYILYIYIYTYIQDYKSYPPKKIEQLNNWKLQGKKNMELPSWVHTFRHLFFGVYYINGLYYGYGQDGGAARRSGF